jgi:hypothetical protein
MNPYVMLGAGLSTGEAAELATRLTAWHDAMVAHERKLRMDATGEVCGDECAHAEARQLWTEAVETFGARADELKFLRSRAMNARRGQFEWNEYAERDTRAIG